MSSKLKLVESVPVDPLAQAARNYAQAFISGRSPRSYFRVTHEAFLDLVEVADEIAAGENTLKDLDPALAWVNIARDALEHTTPRLDTSRILSTQQEAVQKHLYNLMMDRKIGQLTLGQELVA
jgi:hypothetical protein